MQPLSSMPLQELKKWLLSQGEREFKANQIFGWIYKKNVLSLDEMSNIGRPLIEKLKENYTYPTLQSLSKQSSKTKETTKFLLKLRDGSLIESVLIISGQRKTVCVSSQVGCKVKCAFCASGKRGFFRNLSAAEMIEQIIFVNNFLQEDQKKQGDQVSHVVFMGMGEPLDNVENVLLAVHCINDPQMLNISQRRITISTVGIVPAIQRLTKENLKINLVLSLHAPEQSLRQKIIPYAKKYPLDDIMLSLDKYSRVTKRNISYEYILIDGFNDQDEHANKLVKLLRNRQCIVNIIPYNPVEGVKFNRPPTKAITNFCNILTSHNIINTRRYTKGDDIAAACGQLAMQCKK